MHVGERRRYGLQARALGAGQAGQGQRRVLLRDIGRLPGRLVVGGGDLAAGVPHHRGRRSGDLFTLGVTGTQRVRLVIQMERHVGAGKPVLQLSQQGIGRSLLVLDDQQVGVAPVLRGHHQVDAGAYVLVQGARAVDDGRGQGSGPADGHVVAAGVQPDQLGPHFARCVLPQRHAGHAARGAFPTVCLLLRPPTEEDAAVDRLGRVAALHPLQGGVDGLPLAVHVGAEGRTVDLLAERPVRLRPRRGVGTARGSDLDLFADLFGQTPRLRLVDRSVLAGSAVRRPVADHVHADRHRDGGGQEHGKTPEGTSAPVPPTRRHRDFCCPGPCRRTFARGITDRHDVLLPPRVPDTAALGTH